MCFAMHCVIHLENGLLYFEWDVELYLITWLLWQPFPMREMCFACAVLQHL